MSDLTELPNVGPVLAGKLRAIDVETAEDLADIGSVEAVLRIGEGDPSACYNMLYALQGAIRGVRWHRIPKAEREQLKADYDARRTPA